MAPLRPIPVTIVTGFLGSGKTTLILRLIPQLRQQNPAYRLALLKNEFGDLAVDSQLAASPSISAVREALNGCICCNLVGQLGPALLELQAAAAPDRFIIETSGSAFPATLALEVNRLARETGRFVLDGVVNVIDVENWSGYEDTSYTARIQARYTDLIVLNKWEAAGERRYDECLDRIGDLEVDVAKVKSDKGFVSLDVVFGLDSKLARTLPGSQADGDHNHGHAHQNEVEVLSVELKGDRAAAVSLPKLQSLLESSPKDEVYRIKAILALSYPPKNSDPDAPQPAPSPSRRYVLNWAFGRWTFAPVAEAAATAGLASVEDVTLKMTMILARYESGKWKKKMESGNLVALDPEGDGELVVKRIA